MVNSTSKVLYVATVAFSMGLIRLTAADAQTFKRWEQGTRGEDGVTEEVSQQVVSDSFRRFQEHLGSNIMRIHSGMCFDILVLTKHTSR